MEIFIHCLKWKTLLVEIEPSDTIDAVKRKIHEAEGIAVERQRLFFQRKLIQDGITLSECNIEHESHLHLGKKPFLQLFNLTYFKYSPSGNPKDERRGTVPSEVLLSRGHCSRDI